MTEANDYARRGFLVGSNFFFILPILKLIYMSTRKDRGQNNMPCDNTVCNCCKRFWCMTSNMNRFLIEIAIFTTTMIVSALYHLCDDDHTWTQTCVTSYDTLQTLDFVFSYHCIVTVVLFLIDHRVSFFKILFHALFLAANVIFVRTYSAANEDDKTIYSNMYYIGISVAGAVLVAGKIIYLKCHDRLEHEFTHHFDWVDFIAGLGFAVIGVFFKIIGDVHSGDYYYALHPLWHMGIMMAIFFGMETYDTKVSLFCWKRERKCDCDLSLNNGNGVGVLPGNNAPPN